LNLFNPEDCIRNMRNMAGALERIFFTAAIILLLHNLPLFSSPVILSEQVFPVNISKSLEYIEDKNGSLTLDQVRAIGSVEWKTNNRDNINFGYTRSAYWFKFALEDVRISQGRLLMEIGFPTLDYVDFYYPDNRGGYGVLKTGDRRLFSTREIRDSSFVFTINPVSDNTVYFFRIENGGSLRFRAKIYTDGSFIADRNISLPVSWFMYGIVMFLAIFYFFILLYLRERLYLYFSLFSMNIFLYQIIFRGFAFQFLWPDHPWWGNVAELVFSCTIGLLSALFMRCVLDTRSTNIILHRLFTFFAFCIFPLLTALSFILPYHYISLMRYYALFTYSILIIPSAAYYMKKGNRFAAYFLAGFGTLMITNSISLLMIFGLIPSMRFIEWSNDIGFIAVIIFSSLGLVDRFKIITDDLIESRQSVNEKNKMLILANEEMAASNEELEAMNEEFEAQNRELLSSEKALMSSEMEMKDIFNSSHDAFIIHDLNGKILDVNNRMLKMYGVSREEALSMSVADISASDSSNPVESVYWKRVLNGEELLFEWKTLRQSDNIEFFVEVGLKKILWRNSDVILASIRDLTERKVSENEREQVRNQLVQAQKMEAVGTLAGGIAHDFNNVLGGIIGSLNLVDILIREEDLKNFAEIHEYLETAAQSSIRAADMTKQLLTLSRKSELKKKPVVVQDSLKHVMNICRNSFPKSVELDLKYDDQMMYIYADPSHIDQALLNLCVNASHSMTLMRGDNVQGGSITVEAHSAQCDKIFCSRNEGSSPDIRYVAISVKDTGVGIDEDIRARIFEPFFTTKLQDEGTGLGLAMTYSIIRQHGGFITVDSNPGEGSIFTIYLPLMDQALNVVPEIKQKIIKGTGLILVIDDEEAILRVTSGILKKCGYDVITASKPLPGIELFTQEKDNISAVILDNSMPGMSGLEVFDVLKTIDPQVRAILCSGFMDNISLQRAREIGIVDFIGKPYDFEELSRKISEVLG